MSYTFTVAVNFITFIAAANVLLSLGITWLIIANVRDAGWKATFKYSLPEFTISSLAVFISFSSAFLLVR